MSDSFPPPPGPSEQPDPGQSPPPPPPQPGWGGQSAYGTPAPPPQPGYGTPAYAAPPPNNLVWGILTTVLCCLPFGIVSIVYAAKVDSLYSSGRVAEAYAASNSAKKWAIVSASVSVGLLALYILFIAVVAVVGSSSSSGY